MQKNTKTQSETDNFNPSEYFQKWNSSIDYRKQPELYHIGRGEQGVLICQPYKSEICHHWKFRTPEIAKESSEKIYQMFLEYLKVEDFVGADMARKYLQMGFTRARRYANHPSGKKYSQTGEKLPVSEDFLISEKAQSAEIFKKVWFQAKENQKYLELKEKFKHSRP